MLEIDLEDLLKLIQYEDDRVDQYHNRLTKKQEVGIIKDKEKGNLVVMSEDRYENLMKNIQNAMSWRKVR